MFKLSSLFAKKDTAKVPSAGAKPLDPQFYRDTPRIPLQGYITPKDAASFGLMLAMSRGLSRRLIIELDSEGCEERAFTIVRGVIAKLSEECDVRMIAKGTCASASLFLMQAVPANCRYAAPGLKMWMDQDNFPDRLTKDFSPEDKEKAKVLIEKCKSGHRIPFTMEDALRQGTFSQVLTWL